MSFLLLEVLGFAQSPLTFDEAEVALIKAGQQHVAEQHYAEAVESFKRAIALNRKSVPAWQGLGDVLMRLAKVDDSIAAFQKVVDINPKRASAYGYLSRLYMQQQRYEDARQAAAKQVALSPHDAEAHLNLATSLFNQKRFPEAAREYKAIPPDSIHASTALIFGGFCYLRMGQIDKAWEFFEKATSSDKSTGDMVAVAQILLTQNTLIENARQLAERAANLLAAASRDVQLKDLKKDQLEATNQLAAAWLELGSAYLEQGDLTKADEYLNASWSLGQQSAAAMLLGQLNEKKRAPKVAAQFYADGLATPSPNPLAPMARARLNKLAPKPAEADGLIKAASNTLSRLRTVSVTMPGARGQWERAEFFVSLSPGPKVDEVKFVSGSAVLKAGSKAIVAAHFQAVFPEGFAGKLIRRGILYCSNGTSACQFVMLLPADVKAIN